MGNTLNNCQNCTTTPPTNPTSLHQLPSYYSSRLTQFQQIQQNIPYYSNVVHSRLANDLRRRGEKFQDLVMPSQGMVGLGGIEWRRIGEVGGKEGFCRGKGLFQFQVRNNGRLGISSSRNLTYNLTKSIQSLTKSPQLIQKLFPNFQVSPQGFYICYFCLGGNIQKRIQIIVDDYIPIDPQTGRYLFEEPREGDGIWVIVLHKVWAKIMTSYHHLECLLPEYFYSEMTGVPLERLYKVGDYLTSGKYQIQANQSKDTPVDMIACIWQAANPDFITDISPPNFIIQIITEQITPQSKQYQLLPTKTQRYGNKLISLNPQTATPSMFQLPKGQTIIHIYNKNKTKKQFNLVLHSKKSVIIHARTQKQFEQAKKAMIRNQYKKIHKNIGAQFQYPEIQFRFCWMKHRGIFCIKNKSGVRKRVQMRIKKEFLGEVFFEDWKTDVKFADLETKEYAFFVVLRSQDMEYGPFYQISIPKEG